MYIFFEKGTRGAISNISNKYSKINNKHLKSYDLKQESKHIICIYVKNLYSYAMSKFLPTTWFKCADPIVFGMHRYTSSSSEGCFLDVALEYPNKITGIT